MATQPSYQIADSWSASAPAYEDLFVPLSAAAARAVGELIAFKPDERFLDVAAGTGALSIVAA